MLNDGDIGVAPINNKMRKGAFPTKEADILLNVAKIMYEFGRLYPSRIFGCFS